RGLLVKASKQIGNGKRVHVTVNLIFAAHAPAERVARGAHAGVDGPPRRYHNLLVGYYEMTRLMRGAHQVYNAVVPGQVEVKIDLGTPHVRVRRHGVPHAARAELRYAHDELATADAFEMNEAVDGSMVRRFRRAQHCRAKRAGFDFCNRVDFVRRVAEQVKLSRMGSVCT